MTTAPEPRPAVAEHINLPGGWYFEQCNPPHGVIYALRTPKGQGFGINGTGMSVGLPVVEAFAAALTAAAQARQAERDAEVERLKAENERLRLGQEYLRLERDEAVARASKAVEVLSLIEWVEDAPDYFCPCCNRKKRYGHYDNCALRAALLSTAPDLGGDVNDTTRGGGNGR